MRDGRRTQKIFYPKTALKETQLTLTIKTRREDPVASIPDKMFSPLKYQIDVDIVTPEAFKGLTLTLKVVEEFGESCVDGLESKKFLQMSMVAPTHFKARFQLKLKKELSFHKTKKRYVVEYFVSSSQQQEVLKVHSPSFQVYSRRPQKRKRVSPSSPKSSSSFQEELPQKKRKICGKGPEEPPKEQHMLQRQMKTFDSFKCEFLELLGSLGQMKQQDRGKSFDFMRDYVFGEFLTKEVMTPPQSLSSSAGVLTSKSPVSASFSPIDGGDLFSSSPFDDSTFGLFEESTSFDDYEDSDVDLSSVFL